MPARNGRFQNSCSTNQKCRNCRNLRGKRGYTMQVGIMSGHFDRPTLEEALDAILGHDIRHLQFNMSSAHLKGPLADEIDAAGPRIREEIENRGMIVSALGGEANMVHPDEDKRGQAIERLKLLISVCGLIGTSVLATCTGSRHPENMWRKHPDNDTDEAWQVLRNTLEQVLPVAEAAAVDIAFEPEVNNVVTTAKKARRLIDEMGSRHLKVVMDASNLFGDGDLPRMSEILDEAFDLLGDHIAIAHGKDLDHDGDAGHLAAGTGKLDYARYVSLLCDLPFDVPIILHSLAEDQVDASVAMLRRHAQTHSVSV